MKKFLAIAATLFVGMTAVASAADTAYWRTIAAGRDSGSHSTPVGKGTHASIVKSTSFGTLGLRLVTRAPRGKVVVEAETICFTADYLESVRGRTWTYWSSGWQERNVRNLPVGVPGGACDVRVDAFGKGGNLSTYLQVRR
jgi:hypothetical protein